MHAGNKQQQLPAHLSVPLARGTAARGWSGEMSRAPRRASQSASSQGKRLLIAAVSPPALPSHVRFSCEPKGDQEKKNLVLMEHDLVQPCVAGSERA